MNDPMGMVVGILVVTATISLIMMYAEGWRNRNLDRYRTITTATITRISDDGLGLYWATAVGRNPYSGAMCSFSGRIDSSSRKGESVEVVFDPHNPRKCYFRRS